MLPKKYIYTQITCGNCGNIGHTYKHCTVPTTSWGIILISFDNLQPPEHTKKIDLLSSQNNRPIITTKNEHILAGIVLDKIKFLLISRKYSVGFVEFIRGRYRCEKIDQLIYIFKQMKQKEIDMINYSLTLDDGFTYLWNIFWNSTVTPSYLLNDKIKSANNYNILKTKGVDGPDLDLQYIVSIIKAEYEHEEWGFPKGRINRGKETELECAIREFKEETGYLDEDIKIISSIEPLVEEFNGTNGICYRHVYYVAELKTDKQPQNNVTCHQSNEIGNIQFMNYISANHYIRDYHIARKKIIQSVYMYYIDVLIASNKLVINNNEKLIKYTESTIL
jgi:8-oxo-dGTP pyrophosphatase MutT (NUDIX family)